MNGALRRGGEYEMVPSDELEALVGDNDVQEGVEAAELAGVISAFLRGRGARERNIFIRRYWFGDKVSDIAAVFGMNESAVKMKLKRTRDRLAALLKKEGYLK
jgi:RNA polymerase sigma-70 factor (ECF subfamily)